MFTVVIKILGKLWKLMFFNKIFNKFTCINNYDTRFYILKYHNTLDTIFFHHHDRFLKNRPDCFKSSLSELEFIENFRYLPN